MCLVWLLTVAGEIHNSSAISFSDKPQANSSATFNSCGENSEQEAVNARKAIEDFIEENRKQGIVVTAKKISEAVPKWKNNPLVRSAIINFFAR